MINFTATHDRHQPDSEPCSGATSTVDHVYLRLTSIVNGAQTCHSAVYKHPLYQCKITFVLK